MKTMTTHTHTQRRRSREKGRKRAALVPSTRQSCTDLGRSQLYYECMVSARCTLAIHLLIRINYIHHSCLERHRISDHTWPFFIKCFKHKLSKNDFSSNEVRHHHHHQITDMNTNTRHKHCLSNRLLRFSHWDFSCCCNGKRWMHVHVRCACMHCERIVCWWWNDCNVCFVFVENKQNAPNSTCMHAEWRHCAYMPIKGMTIYVPNPKFPSQSILNSFDRLSQSSTKLIAFFIFVHRRPPPCCPSVSRNVCSHSSDFHSENEEKSTQREETLDLIFDSNKSQTSLSWKLLFAL